MVDSFCYLGDTLSAGGGCELGSIARIRVAWGKFRQLLPILTSRSISIAKRSEIYSSCIRSTMLHGIESWAISRDTLLRMRRNDRAMIRWICNVRLLDRVNSNTFLSCLHLSDITDVLRQRRLRWFGHVSRINGWIKRVIELQMDGEPISGRPKKTWCEVIVNDRKLWKMNTIDPSDRSSWRCAMTNAMKSSSIPT